MLTPRHKKLRVAQNSNSQLMSPLTMALDGGVLMASPGGLRLPGAHYSVYLAIYSTPLWRPVSAHGTRAVFYD